ncbi:MAG: RagB/SusD family nutrient uptake outer membrane protein [Bacteroidales bacterium]|nr:RagB/SusD family nutrient uptake outer membrane protein [Bacteroidales bacterium]
MKNIINKILIGLGIAAVLSLTACSLETTSVSTFDPKSVYSDPTLAQYEIYSIYEVFSHTNCHRGRYQPYYGYNTDIEWETSNTWTNATTQIMRYDCAANNATMNVSGNPYDELFAGVERANLAIEGIREYGDIENNAEMASLLGEALTARAMLYLELLKGYGEVPARFEPASSENMYMNKADKDVIYKQILGDLEEAFNYLDYNTTTRSDKVGLAFAKGLYARIALYASGYSQRPDDGQVGTGNTGSVRLSNDPELQKSVLYPKALEYLKDVIANSGLYLEDYKTLWKSVNEMTNTTYGPEVIFIIPYSNSRGRWNYTHAIRHEGYTVYNPSTSSHGGTSGVVPYVYYWYGENDVRRDISCVNYSWDPDRDADYPYPAGIANWYFGKYRFEWMTNNPYDGGNDDGVKPIYMRYAEILLMAAEIANSSEGGVRDENYAKQCLKTVMERAYANDPSEGDAEVDALSGEDEIFSYIKKQRALEFVGEFLRKADLIRWNELKTAMDKAADELAELRAGEVGDITGVDYGQLFNPDNESESNGPRQYCWYYKYTDEDKLPNIYIYGIHLGETECSATQTPPGAYDWIQYTNSDGEVSSYISSSSFTSSSSGTDRTVSEGFYANDPNTQQYWPIPETSITNGQGYLVNDYGF